MICVNTKGMSSLEERLAEVTAYLAERGICEPLWVFAPEAFAAFEATPKERKIEALRKMLISGGVTIKVVGRKKSFSIGELLMEEEE